MLADLGGEAGASSSSTGKPAGATLRRAFHAAVGHLAAPVDAASLTAFRVLLGALMALALVRAMSLGWVQDWYLTPAFHFKYWGFGWVHVPPAPVLYGLFALAAFAATCIAVGLAYRAACVVFLLAFSYIELLDVSFYLNHYYLVSLLAALACCLPLHRAGSLDVRWGLAPPAPRHRGRASLPRGALWLLRFQLAVVYLYAGLAKAGTDWLVHGQPLGIWLSARVDLPLVGPYLVQPWVAPAMSWAGFLFDTTIVAFLLVPRLRLGAYAVLVVFHTATGALFNIGMFPYLMTAGALLFFEPSWPRDALNWLRGRLGTGNQEATRPASEGSSWSHRSVGWGLLLAIPFVLFQLLFPLRHLAYPGNVLWTEEGMRFAWKVMIRAKSGSVRYRVRYAGAPGELQVSPRRYLTAYQEREMSGQPDLILQLAQRIARDFEARGHRDVEVRADTAVSLNGRAARPLIDPQVDLNRVRQSWAPASWILPGPDEAPPHLRPISP